MPNPRGGSRVRTNQESQTTDKKLFLCPSASSIPPPIGARVPPPSLSHPFLGSVPFLQQWAPWVLEGWWEILDVFCASVWVFLCPYDSAKEIREHWKAYFSSAENSGCKGKERRVCRGGFTTIHSYSSFLPHPSTRAQSPFPHIPAWECPTIPAPAAANIWSAEYQQKPPNQFMLSRR